MPDVFPTLPELYAKRSTTDGRPYRINIPDFPQPWFAQAKSAMAATLAVLESIGGSAEAVTMREQNKAMSDALAQQYRKDHPDLFTESEPEDREAYRHLLADLAIADTPQKRAKVREAAISARTKELISLEEATEIQDLIAKANGGVA